jgi:hypothetical protein
VVVVDVWWVLCRRALQLHRCLRHLCALSIIPTSARVYVNHIFHAHPTCCNHPALCGFGVKVCVEGLAVTEDPKLIRDLTLLCLLPRWCLCVCVCVCVCMRERMSL